jgi:hypothetical protein
MTVIRLLVDAGVPVSGLPGGVEVVVIEGPLAAAVGDGPAGDIVVASADPEILAEAGRLGAHRLVVDDPAATAAVLTELVADLTHRSSPPVEPA